MDFGRTFRNGSMITIISQIIKIGIGLIITGILSRLLTPDEYGVVAIVFVFLNLFDLLSNIGLGVGVIQFKNMSNEELSYVHVVSIIISFFMMAAFIISSPLIVIFYHEPLYYKIIPIVALNIVLTGYRTIPEAILRRDFKFKRLNILFLISDISGGVGAIFLAYTGWGVYALILRNIISNFILIVVESINIGFRFTWSFPKKKMKKFFSFSFYQFRFNIINYITRNIDDLLIGKYLDTQQLGIYDRAYKLTKYPLESVKGVLNNVFYPLLSCYQDRQEEQNKLYIKVLRLFLLIFIPMTAVLDIMSEEIIIILYGTEWYQTISIFRILALSVWVQVISAMGSIYLQSTGRTDLLVVTGKYLNCFSILGIIIGLFFGIKGVAIGFTAGYYIGFFFSFNLIFTIMSKKIIDFLRLLFFPIIISVILCVLAMGIKNIISSIILRAVVEGVCITGVYIIILKVSGMEKEFREIFK